MNKGIVPLFLLLLMVMSHQSQANFISYTVKNLSSIPLEYIVNSEGCGLRIQTRDGRNEGHVCKYGILSSGETKEINFFSPIIFWDSNLKLTLWDEKGNIVASCNELGEKEIRLTGVSPNIYTENECEGTLNKFPDYQIPENRYTT